MSSKDDTNVHDLLNTLLVPTYPPNRSQWKKLELALKFINMSKQSAKESRSCSATANVTTEVNRRKQAKRSRSCEPATKKPKMMLIDPCKTVSIIPKNESSWTKIKDSLQHLL